MKESNESNISNHLIDSNEEPHNLIQFLQNSDETNILEMKIGKNKMPSKIIIFNKYHFNHILNK
jgi:hypothetical protein